MKSKILISLAFALTLLTGCASGPSYDEYASSIPSIPSESGRIYVYRIATFGAAIQPGVKVNDVVAGKAVPKGFFYVDKPAGSYEISASTEVERALTLNLEAGEEKYVRLEVKVGLFAGHIKPVLVDSAIGKEEIMKTKYIGE